MAWGARVQLRSPPTAPREPRITLSSRACARVCMRTSFIVVGAGMGMDVSSCGSAPAGASPAMPKLPLSLTPGAPESRSHTGSMLTARSLGTEVEGSLREGVWGG